MGAAGNVPVIIKRKKVIAGDGHHGGAWKVAYADFVTAMMAFFMLMWLLNATTETQRKGIADYFSPTIPINRISGGGDGAFGGDSIFTEETLSQNGTGASLPNPSEADRAKGPSGIDDAGTTESAQAEAFEKLEDIMAARAGESMVSELLQRHIITRVTDEGLIVELRDLPDSALFGPSDEMTAIMKELLALVAEVFQLVENEVAINGYVAARPVVAIANPVWDLSTKRADMVRLGLEELGFPAARMQRVTGFADRKPGDANPMSALNNRIELILLRGKR